MAIVGQARNNLSPQAQKKAKSDDARIAELERRMNAIDSQNLNKQINRLATGVGNKSMRVVPFVLDDIPVGFSGDPTLAPMPDLDLTYDWVLVLATSFTTMNFATSAARSHYVSVAPIIDGVTAPTGWGSSSDFVIPSQSSYSTTVTIAGAIDIRDVVSPVWEYEIQPANTGDVNFTDGTADFIGTLVYFKETL